jgi:molybdopterin-guanine dinucleotide biosynthesis protein A
MNEIIAVILAGGASSRMGGRDKALSMIDGRRLVDIVVERMSRQATRIVLSAPRDYETGCEFVADDAAAPAGPARGVIAVARRLAVAAPAARGFATVPVDAPNFPDDLVARLSAGESSAIAAAGDELQPTFAWWASGDVARIDGVQSLKRLAELTKARIIRWPDAAAFSNINTPEELAAFRSGDAADAKTDGQP